MSRTTASDHLGRALDIAQMSRKLARRPDKIVGITGGSS